MSVISVIIVDDHPIVVEGLRSLLQHKPEITILNSFINGKDVLPYLNEHPADVVLLDINLPDISGIELCRQIKQTYPQTKVLALSNHSEHSMIAQMLQSGASGYLLKNAPADELLKAIEEVTVKTVFLSSEVQKVLLDAYSNTQDTIPVLTRRELEILRWLADGHTTNAIADKLFISPLTVETHRRNLMQKFEVNNVAALIKKAVDCKIL
ncbi:response regulator transcription factor [Cytophagaceae bacterium DM2B3-1]|uniref:Response regulator transcription factor n=1 Tax=Xanthocytophaga flava TaxID=3048013 RepID=A0ABT7CIP7_9BACT|nr:response regulator transcription factor [Xanthocytophaga flavus]MDJ1493604.1 response regulator transcription factor [Xanthocytophaga flavus]